MTVCTQCQHPDQSGLLSLLVLNGISRVTHRSSALFSSYSSSYSYILPSFPFYVPFLHCPPFLSSSWHILQWPTLMWDQNSNCLHTVWLLFFFFQLTAFVKNLILRPGQCQAFWFTILHTIRRKKCKNYTFRGITPAKIVALSFQRYTFVSYLSVIYL